MPTALPSFNRTGESLPIPLLMHASSNNVVSVLSHDLFPTVHPGAGINPGTLGIGALAVVLLVGTRGRLGYPGVPATQDRENDGQDRSGGVSARWSS